MFTELPPTSYRLTRTDKCSVLVRTVHDWCPSFESVTEVCPRRPGPKCGKWSVSLDRPIDHRDLQHGACQCAPTDITWRQTSSNEFKQATRGLWSSAGLKMPVHAQFYRPAIWTRKVGQCDLVYDVRLGFASGFVCAILEVSVYNG